MIRVVLPFHLKRLAGTDSEVTLEVRGTATQRSVVDELERLYPALRGTIRDLHTRKRRPFGFSMKKYHKGLPIARWGPYTSCASPRSGWP